jgi:hypothetical protein
MEKLFHFNRRSKVDGANRKRVSQFLFTLFILFIVQLIMVSVILTTSPKDNSGFKYGLEVKDKASAQPTSTQATVNIQAAALNHR